VVQPRRAAQRQPGQQVQRQAEAPGLLVHADPLGLPLGVQGMADEQRVARA